MTLTSTKTPKRSLRQSFQNLRNRIKRAKLARCGFNGFNFNRYYCLRTDEGNGVLHIVFWGKYIPIDWLRNAWYEIHGAVQADVRMVSTKKNKVNGLVGYLLDRYLMKQKVKRMSYGWKWAWLGFCKSWKNVKENYRLLRVGQKELRSLRIHRAASGAYYSKRNGVPFIEMYRSRSIEAWRSILWEHPVTSRQTRFTDGRWKSIFPVLEVGTFFGAANY